jgi:hypothetical protein
MPTNTGILQSIAVQAWAQTFAGPGHHAHVAAELGEFVERFKEFDGKYIGESS